MSLGLYSPHLNLCILESVVNKSSAFVTQF